MSDELKLNKPWLVAVWPGMGNVALSAGFYLMAKLEMHVLSEYSAGELFDVEHVEVKGGLIRAGRLPRSRLFAWTDPNRKRDIVVFIGEAQPPSGKYAFCHKLIETARELGVERVFTFAAMSTAMRPEAESRVFAAATDGEMLKDLTRLELEILEDGRIGGLNGVLLGAAAERGLSGACLLGEIPQIFSQLPFPKASVAVLRVFMTIAGIEIDLAELSEQARATNERLGELLTRIESTLEKQSLAATEGYSAEPADEGYSSVVADEGLLTHEDERRVEELFKQAALDRSKAFELQRELDRLGVFKDYEDRFLDLFKKSS